MDKEIKQNCRQQGQGLSDLMTEKQLAEYLKVSIYTVRRMRLSEGLPTLKFDNMRAILYYRPAVEDWLRARSLPWKEDMGDGDTADRDDENTGDGGRTKYRMAPIPD